MPHCSKLIMVPCMQNFTVNECGAVHITMGDGGNIEGLCKLLVSSPKLLHACITSAVMASLFHEFLAQGIWPLLWAIAHAFF